MADQTINVNCGFFDSIEEDRLYSASEMNRPYRRLVSNGVFATPQGTPSTDLQVIANGEDMDIIVKKGEGIFANKWFENASNLSITVPNNNEIVPRIDSVIAQVNTKTSSRTGNIVYRTGTASANPQAPLINTDVDIVEYRIANVYVVAGATAIMQSNVTDLRGDSECPWITSLIQQVDLSQLFTQYQNWFNERKAQSESELEDFEDEQEDAFTTWFNSMKGQLSQDAAGNLQNEIDAINNKSVYSTTEKAIGTWIDGKTIYRKVVNVGKIKDYVVEEQHQNHMKSGSTYITEPIVDKLLKAEILINGTRIFNNNEYTINFPVEINSKFSVVDDAYAFDFYLNAIYNAVYLDYYIGTVYYDKYKNDNLTAIIEYTKTS